MSPKFLAATENFDLSERKVTLVICPAWSVGMAEFFSLWNHLVLSKTHHLQNLMCSKGNRKKVAVSNSFLLFYITVMQSHLHSHHLFVEALMVNHQYDGNTSWVISEPSEWAHQWAVLLLLYWGFHHGKRKSCHLCILQQHGLWNEMMFTWKPYNAW